MQTLLLYHRIERDVHGMRGGRVGVHFCDVFGGVCVERERLRAAELRGGTICERQFVCRVPVGAMVQRRDGDFLLALLKHLCRKRQMHRLFRFGQLHRRFMQ